MEVYVDDMLVKIGRRLPTSLTFRKPLQQFDSMVRSSTEINVLLG